MISFSALRYSNYTYLFLVIAVEQCLLSSGTQVQPRIMIMIILVLWDNIHNYACSLLDSYQPL